jgi:hypothetical protein
MKDMAKQVIDDRRSNALLASNGMNWRAVSDTVMGGVSSGELIPTETEGRHCLRLTGKVSLENNGGFVQASLDLCSAGLLDASDYSGIEIEIYGNGEVYNLHLRTDDTRIVWQSYRASFHALPHWQTLRLRFDDFQPHRIDKPLDIKKLRRFGVVAIGREMQADVCIGRVSLFR